jgi:hypothetical protein
MYNDFPTDRVSADRLCARGDSKWLATGSLNLQRLR